MLTELKIARKLPPAAVRRGKCGGIRAKLQRLHGAERGPRRLTVESFGAAPPAARARPGTNVPPSAESLRKIREDSNVWCPSDRRAEEYRKSLKNGDDA